MTDDRLLFLALLFKSLSAQLGYRDEVSHLQVFSFAMLVGCSSSCRCNINPLKKISYLSIIQHTLSLSLVSLHYSIQVQLELRKSTQWLILTMLSQSWYFLCPCYYTALSVLPYWSSWVGLMPGMFSIMLIIIWAALPSSHL